jgi:hypothetical protein
MHGIVNPRGLKALSANSVSQSMGKRKTCPSMTVTCDYNGHVFTSVQHIIPRAGSISTSETQAMMIPVSPERHRDTPVVSVNIKSDTSSLGTDYEILGDVHYIHTPNHEWYQAV